MIPVRLSLGNAARDDVAAVDVDAIVATGSTHLSIPKSVQLQLGLCALGEREVHLSDGRLVIAEYVGPVVVGFKNRQAVTGAVVMGDTVLLGMIPMADLDLIIAPATGAVDVNPDSPNIPLSGPRPAWSKAMHHA